MRSLLRALVILLSVFTATGALAVPWQLIGSTFTVDTKNDQTFTWTYTTINEKSDPLDISACQVDTSSKPTIQLVGGGNAKIIFYGCDLGATSINDNSCRNVASLPTASGSFGPIDLNAPNDVLFGDVRTVAGGGTVTVSCRDVKNQAYDAATGGWVTSEAPNAVAAIASGSYTKWTLPDLDDSPGVADNVGADANPMPGSMVATIKTGVFPANLGATTNTIDPIHDISIYNGRPGAVDQNPNIHTSMFYFEHCFDQNQRSPRCLDEMNYDIIPTTHLLGFSSRFNDIPYGSALTFSNGAICKPLAQYAAAQLTAIRVQCVDHLGPANSNTITDCKGPADPVSECSPDPTGTVNAVVDEKLTVTRYLAGNWNSAVNAYEFRLMGSPGRSFLHTDGASAVLKLGWGGNEVESLGSVVQLRGHPNATNFVFAEGAISVDTTNNSTFGGQWRYHDGSAERAITPVKMQCQSFTATGTTATNVQMDFNSWNPATIVAFGARDKSAASSSATWTFDTDGGAAITLAGTLTSSGNTADMAYQTTVDPDAVLPSGGAIRFSAATLVNTEVYTVCAAYRDTVQ